MNRDDIENCRDKLEQMQDRYLVERGWKRISLSPLCYWVWEKEIEGVTYRVGRSYAIDYEDRLELDKEEEEEVADGCAKNTAHR